MTIIDPQDDFGPSTAERLTREFGDGVGAIPFSEMDAQNARAEKIMAEFGAAVNEAAGLPTQTMTQAISEIEQRNQISFPIDLSPGWADAPPVKVVEFPVDTMPIEAQAVLAAGYRDELRLSDGQLELDLAPLMRQIDEARAKHAEATKARREAVAAIETRIRAHVVEKKESMRGPYFLCSYVKASKRVSWETDKLEGFAAALDDKLKAALLAFKKETDVAATTQWKNR